MPKKTPATSVALFQERTVRRVWHEEQWFFSVIDVIAVLTESAEPRRYWSDLKRKLKEEEGFIEVYEKIVQLKMEAPDGKLRQTDAANARTLLRVIQSITSPKAEPFKQWLAQVGAQRLEEIDNPELSLQRMRELYKAKGYPDEWIETRVRGIEVRNELTDAWHERGAHEGTEYAILTSEISQATFGLSVADHRAFKGIERENLRDHMSRMELVLNMFAEATTHDIHEARDSQGFDELRVDAKDGGDVAGRARRDVEAQTGRPVVTPRNFLHLASSVAPQNAVETAPQTPAADADEE